METKRLFKDEGFADGFKVIARRHGRGHKDVAIDTFQYPTAQGEPKWLLEQWHSRHCIKKEKYESEAYVLENAAKRIEVKPQERYISLTLNGTAEYNGRPHINKRVLWPHLLLEQITYDKFADVPEEEKKFYSCEFEKLSCELDVRLKHFADTNERRGILACQFMAYFYLQLKDDDGFIYFGINIFDSRGLMKTYWALDVEGRAMIYLLSTEETFGGAEKSFNADNAIIQGDEWKHIEIDLTPHIDTLLEKINSELVFGRNISREDLYVRGTNIGFETHGNLDCTIEVKNYNLVAVAE